MDRETAPCPARGVVSAGQLPQRGIPQPPALAPTLVASGGSAT